MKLKKTVNLEEAIRKKADIEELKEILSEIEEKTLAQQLNQLLAERNLLIAEIIKKTALDRTYAYQIFDGRRIPGRDKVLQIAIALSCTVDMTNCLLTLSKHQKLYAKVKRDAALILMIEKKFQLSEVNYQLEWLGFEVLD